MLQKISQALPLVIKCQIMLMLKAIWIRFINILLKYLNDDLKTHRNM